MTGKKLRPATDVEQRRWLANLLIERLNEIARHDPVAMGLLVGVRVRCNDALADHPTVQVHHFDKDKPPVVGMLGIINGLVGVIDDGPKKGWGLITAICEDDGSVSGFRRTTEDYDA